MINENNIIIIIKTLMNYSDTFWEKDPYLLYFNNSYRLEELYINLFGLIHNQEKRFKILIESIKETKKSVYSYIKFINKLHLNSKKFSNSENSENELIVNSKQLESLKDLASQKINSTPIDLLLKNKYSHFILIIWSYWAKTEDLTEFFKKIEKKNEYLIKFIILFKDSNFNPSEINLNLGIDKEHFNLKAMLKYDDIQNIANKITKIPIEEYEEYKEDINQFLQESALYYENCIK